MSVLNKFARNLAVKRFERGQTILHQGDELKHVYIVKKGIVKCFDISLDGNEQIIWLAATGNIMPLSYVFDMSNRSLFFYSAFIDAELYIVDKQKLVDYLKSDPELLFDLCRLLTELFDDLHFRVNAAEKPKAQEKIMHTLAFLSDRFISKKRGGHVEVALPLTHQDIASLVGLTRETTAVTLKKLKDEGFIDYDRTSLVVYRDKIEKTLWQ